MWSGVALDCADQRQRDPGAAAGILDHCPARLQASVSLRRLDHGERHPILHAAGRVLAFDFEQDAGAISRHDMAQRDERGSADAVENGRRGHAAILMGEGLSPCRLKSRSGQVRNPDRAQANLAPRSASSARSTERLAMGLVLAIAADREVARMRQRRQQVERMTRRRLRHLGLESAGEAGPVLLALGGLGLRHQFGGSATAPGTRHRTSSRWHSAPSARRAARAGPCRCVCLRRDCALCRGGRRGRSCAGPFIAARRRDAGEEIELEPAGKGPDQLTRPRERQCRAGRFRRS
jgi:hypothetical protein